MIPLKDGTDYEIPEDFLSELESVYYNVPDELRKMRLWCLANPGKLKTRKGVKRFINNWFRDKPMKPVAATTWHLLNLPTMSPESLETRLNHLSKLREALKS